MNVSETTEAANVCLRFDGERGPSVKGVRTMDVLCALHGDPCAVLCDGSGAAARCVGA